jgi:hypothetical protein
MSELNKRKHDRRGSRRVADDPPGERGSRAPEEGGEEGMRRPSADRSEAPRERERRAGAARGRAGSGGARGLGRALRAGGSETGGQLAGAGRTAAVRIESALVAIGRLTQRAIGLLVTAAAVIAPYLQVAGRALERAVAAASRVVTPSRAIALTAIGCALLLGASQFADYRGVGIGTEQYRGLESVAPAPEVDRRETGSAHSYLLLPAALLAIAALGLALRTRRWRACRIAAAVGVAAVAVSIFIDRPQGLDPGPAARDFTGVEASLLGGFWMQLCAGIALTITSLLLAAELRREPARGPRRARHPERGAPADRDQRRRERVRARDTGAIGGAGAQPEGSSA